MTGARTAALASQAALDPRAASTAETVEDRVADGVGVRGSTEACDTVNLAGRRPRLLDLFCKAGGAAMGYHRAGFDVVGVDIEPQPNYPFEFHQADALALVQDVLLGCWHESVKSSLPGRLAACLGHFDAIHASPTCQRWSAMATLHPEVDHPDQITPIRPLLEASGLPWVMENVEGAPLIDPLLLCGSMFDPPMDVKRHRLFENNWACRTPDWPCRHKLWSPRFPAEHREMQRRGRMASVVGVYGEGRYKGSDALRERVMGIDWMTRKELAQAIPPTYTEYIGHQLLDHLANTVKKFSSISSYTSGIPTMEDAP